MTSQPLSPAAQAVEDAYFNADGFGYRNGLAAVLRAAADQVVPDIGYEADCLHEPVESELQCVRNRFLAIAAELDNTSPPSK
jgi:hypothetical protein